MSPGREVVVQRVMPALPDDVYQEWIDPIALADWMCPRPAYPTKIECEPRVGGTFRMDIDDSGTSMTVTGRYLELRRPHSLRFSWYCSTWPPGMSDSVVTVTFEPYGEEQTLMTIRHGDLDPSLFDQHERGWLAIAEQLETALR